MFFSGLHFHLALYTSLHLYPVSGYIHMLHYTTYYFYIFAYCMIHVKFCHTYGSGSSPCLCFIWYGVIIILFKFHVLILLSVTPLRLCHMSVQCNLPSFLRDLRRFSRLPGDRQLYGLFVTYLFSVSCFTFNVPNMSRLTFFWLQKLYPIQV